MLCRSPSVNKPHQSDTRTATAIYLHLNAYVACTLLQYDYSVTHSIFTFQDLKSGLYVSRTDDLGLERTQGGSDSIYLELKAIRGKYPCPWS